MKLLRIIANGLPLFKDKIDLCFLATQRVNDKQKKSLYHLFSNVYLNFTNGFIGINASGKTSILKVILLCLKIVNNEPINHIECKSILGEAKSVTFNIYFYSNKANEICLLKTKSKINIKSEIQITIWFKSIVFHFSFYFVNWHLAIFSISIYS